MSVEDAADDLVAVLSAQLIEQAGDEWHASWATGDPFSRVEELLADSRAEYGDEIVDRAEADAWSEMVGDGRRRAGPGGPAPEK